MVLRCIRPDKCVPEMTTFIAETMGEQFVDPPSFDLKVSYEVSTCETPIMFVLTPGADPMTVLNRLADEMGMNDSSTFLCISLGQVRVHGRRRLFSSEETKGCGFASKTAI